MRNFGKLASIITIILLTVLGAAKAFANTLNVTTCKIPQGSNNCEITIDWQYLGSPGQTVVIKLDSGSVGSGYSGSVKRFVSKGDHTVVMTVNGGLGNMSRINIEYEAYVPPPSFNWTEQTHNVISGDFNGDFDGGFNGGFDDEVYQDRFIQPKNASEQSALLPSESGEFLPDFHRIWSGKHLNISQIEDWSEESYGAYSGNFNAEPGDELLLLGNKTIVLLHGDIITPITIFPQVNNAIVSWNSSAVASYSEFKFDANPADYVVHVGNLDNDEYDEIFLQAKKKGGTSHILDNDGSLIQTISNGFLNAEWSAQTYNASITGGNIQLDYIGNAEDNNIAVTNSYGQVIHFDYPITKPTISGEPPRYVYKGQNFEFQPDSQTATTDLTFSFPSNNSYPEWMRIASDTGLLYTRVFGSPEGPSDLIPVTSGNQSYNVTVLLEENKTHTIDTSMTFKLDVLEAFTFVDEEFDVYIASNGEVYLKSKSGSAYYKIVRDGDNQWVIKISVSEFNASGAVLNTSYETLVKDFDTDGLLDLVIYPTSGNTESFAISDIYAQTHEVVVGGASEFFIPDQELITPQIPANESVGAVSGQGSVSGGSASYSVPIAVPPGRRGMQPSVSLNYSSTNGNGIVGKGWSLSTSSTITRCGSIQAIDGVTLAANYSSTDNFCLDGKRLIQDPSSDYLYFELDPSVRVSYAGYAAAGPTQFTVELPNGNIRYYGGGNNSSQFAVNSSGEGFTKALRWALREEVDLFNNNIKYYYDKLSDGNGEYVLDYILYTGSGNTAGNRKVDFTYETRNDASFSYMAQGRSTNSQRLQKIETFVGTDKVSSYALTYKYSGVTEKSLLTEVKQCGYKKVVDNDIETTVEACLEPTQFYWQDSGADYVVKKLFDQAEMSDWATQYSDLDAIIEPDLNGDGVKEVHIRKDNRNDTRYDYSNLVLDASGNIAHQHDGHYTLSEIILYLNPQYGDYEFHNAPEPIDYDNDGIADKYTWLANGNSLDKAEFAFVKYSDFVDGVATSSETIPTGLIIEKLSGQGNDWWPILPYVIDLNGDGLVDLLHNGPSASDPTKRVLHMYLNIGTAEAPTFSNAQLIYSYIYGDRSLNQLAKSRYDFDGNGIPDLYIKNLRSTSGYERILFGFLDQNGTLSYTEKTFGTDIGFLDSEIPSKNYSQFLDINGDGLLDYLFVPHTENQPAGEHTWHYKLNYGGKWGAATDTGVSDGVDKKLSSSQEFPYTPRYAKTFKIGDWDNDGISDILVPQKNESGSYMPAVENNYCIMSSALDGTPPGFYALCAGGAEDSLYPNYAGLDQALYSFNMIKFKPKADGTVEVEVKDADIELPGATDYSKMSDVNGDGLTDIIVKRAKWAKVDDILPADSDQGGLFQEGTGIYIIYGKGGTNAQASGSTISQKPDLMTKVVNGLGYEEQWEYFPLTHPGYSDETTPFYQTDYEVIDGDDYRDYTHFIEGTHVVASHKVSNGIGGLNENRYFYKGAVFNNQGRGFQGFKQIIVDNPNNIRAVTNFHQMFPYAGKIESMRSCVYDVNDLECSLEQIEKTSTKYGTKVAFNDISQWVFTKENISQTYTLNEAAAVKTVTSTVSVDDVDGYGNVEKAVTTIEDGFATITTTNETAFLPTTNTGWWPNKVDYSTVEKKTDSVESEYRAYDSTLDPTKKIKQSFTWTTERQPDIVKSSVITGSGKSSVVDTDYNAYGQVQKVKSYEPDADGNPASNIRTVSTTYDDYFEKNVTTAAGTVTKTFNKGLGLPVSVTDMNDNVTSYFYDAFGRLEQTNAPGVPSQYIRYAGYSSPTILSDAKYTVTTLAAGAPKVVEYRDILNRPIAIKSQIFNNTATEKFAYVRTEYNALGQKTFESVPSSALTGSVGTTYNSYDVLGRLEEKTVTQTEDQSLVIGYSYGKYQTTVTVNDELTLYRTYNGIGQLIQTTDALNGVTRYAYDAWGNPIVLKDANGQDITASYNALGQKNYVDDPNMGTKSFTYNSFGEVYTETDANGNQTTFSYDGLGRITQKAVSGTSASISDFVFDSNGTDEDKCKGFISHEYKGSEFKRTYHYNDLCQLTSVKTILNEGGSTEETFEVASHFDGNYGRVKGVTYPGGLTVGYKYSKEGYLKQSYNSLTGYIFKDISEVDVQGNWTSASAANSNATISRNFYLSTGQLEHTEWFNSGISQQKLAYEYEEYGNLSLQTVKTHLQNTVSESYSYDELHRLTATSRSIPNITPAPASYSFAYDAVGNIKKKTDFSANQDNAYSYGDSTRSQGNGYAGPNAVKSVILPNGLGVRTYSYDSNGNLTAEYEGSYKLRSIAYNAFNKPVHIQVFSGKINPLLDGENTAASNAYLYYGSDEMRYKQVKTSDGKASEHLYIGKLFERVTTIEGNVKTVENKSYVDDIAVVTEKTVGTAAPSVDTTFYHRDRLGSMTAEIDENGNIIRAHSYDAFGRPRNENLEDKSALQQLLGASTNRGFTNHEHLDESQLIHMNGRVYDYNLGRFLSVDPFIQEPGNSQSMNPYSYIMNNPLAGTDPSGYYAVYQCSGYFDCKDKGSQFGYSISTDSSAKTEQTSNLLVDESDFEEEFVFRTQLDDLADEVKAMSVSATFGDTEIEKSVIGLSSGSTNLNSNLSRLENVPNSVFSDSGLDTLSIRLPQDSPSLTDYAGTLLTGWYVTNEAFACVAGACNYRPSSEMNTTVFKQLGRIFTFGTVGVEAVEFIDGYKKNDKFAMTDSLIDSAVAIGTMWGGALSVTFGVSYGITDNTFGPALARGIASMAHNANYHNDGTKKSYKDKYPEYFKGDYHVD